MDAVNTIYALIRREWRDEAVRSETIEAVRDHLPGGKAASDLSINVLVGNVFDYFQIADAFETDPVIAWDTYRDEARPVDINGHTYAEMYRAYAIDEIRRFLRMS